MKNLKDIDDLIKPAYDSGQLGMESGKILTNFWEPVLEASTEMFRGVAYFNSQGILRASRGLKEFLDKPNAKIKLLVGMITDDEDLNMIKHGYDLKGEYKETIDAHIIKKFEEILEDMVDESHWHTSLLSHLIALDKLEIKIAIQKQGDFHCKYGYISDGENAITLSGSNNESKSAVFFNSENFTVSKSWYADKNPESAFYDIERFVNNWWKGEGLANAAIIPFPDACVAGLLKVTENENVDDFSRDEELIEKLLEEQQISSYIESPKTPEGDLRDYQKEALKKWWENNHRGILEHCTAAGKTYTSLSGATKTYETNNDDEDFKMALIVMVPRLPIAYMWYEEMQNFGWDPIECHTNFNNWENRLADEINLFRSGAKNNISLIVTQVTYRTKKFQSLLSKIEKKNIFFIGDECHNQNNLAKDIPNDFEYMMGLSATVEDDDENERDEQQVIKKLYNGIVHEFTIEEGLTKVDPITKKTYLTPFDYYIHRVDLTEKETNRYNSEASLVKSLLEKKKRNKLTKKEAEQLGKATGKLRRILSNCSDKMVKLEDCIKVVDDESKSFTLFYSGEGKYEGGIDDDEDDEEILDDQEKQIDKISVILDKYNWSNSKYTSETNKTKRLAKSTLENFKNGKVNALVAMKCLDEGVNIPAIKTAYITASGRREREYIQRAGRILRRSKGKDFSTIHDFVVFPFNPKKNKRLVAKEFERVKWFYDLARNKKELKPVIKKLTKGIIDNF